MNQVMIWIHFVKKIPRWLKVEKRYEWSKIIDFFGNAVVPFDDKSARKLSLTKDSFYIGRDGLLYRNQKRGNKD